MFLPVACNGNREIALPLQLDTLVYKLRFTNDTTERNTWSRHVAALLSYLWKCFKSFVLIKRPEFRWGKSK